MFADLVRGFTAAVRSLFSFPLLLYLVFLILSRGIPTGTLRHCKIRRARTAGDGVPPDSRAHPALAAIGPERLSVRYNPNRRRNAVLRDLPSSSREGSRMRYVHIYRNVPCFVAYDIKTYYYIIIYYIIIYKHILLIFSWSIIFLFFLYIIYNIYNIYNIVLYIYSFFLYNYYSFYI